MSKSLPVEPLGSLAVKHRAAKTMNVSVPMFTVDDTLGSVLTLVLAVNTVSKHLFLSLFSAMFSFYF